MGKGVKYGSWWESFGPSRSQRGSGWYNESRPISREWRSVLVRTY